MIYIYALKYYYFLILVLGDLFLGLGDLVLGLGDLVLGDLVLGLGDLVLGLGDLVLVLVYTLVSLFVYVNLPFVRRVFQMRTRVLVFSFLSHILEILDYSMIHIFYIPGWV